MAYANGTPNYDLPQTADTDVRTWDDTNTAFLAIDAAIKKNADDIDTLSKTDTSVASQISSLTSRISALESSMTTAQSDISTLQTDVTTLEGKAVTNDGTGLTSAEYNKLNANL